MALHSNERIRTLEVSDAEFACDGVRLVTMYSPALRGRGDASVFLPPAAEACASVPMVVLLHGVYGSHWAWFLKGAAHRTASDLLADRRIRPMVLVAPSDGLQGDGSGYLPHPQRDAEGWIVCDLLEGVRKTFPCVDEQSPVFIAGLSMGGYGALRLGAKYARLFRGISAHSAITDIAEMDEFTFEPFSSAGVAPVDLDVIAWMERNRESLPPLRFDCGAQDPLLGGNRVFHAALDARAIPHTYSEPAGGHEWSYWRGQMSDTLLFFEEVLSGREREALPG
jgi:enterochelin esterase-like enzyme